MHLQLF